jgi:heme exporter protein D
MGSAATGAWLGFAAALLAALALIHMHSESQRHTQLVQKSAETLRRRRAAIQQARTRQGGAKMLANRRSAIINVNILATLADPFRTSSLQPQD